MTSAKISEQRRPRPLRMWPVLRGTTSMLAAPQGFTLSVAGTLAATIGQRDVAGLLEVWLFVVGGSAGFCLVAVAGGVLHRPGPRGGLSVSRRAVLNVAPVAVVPVAVGGSLRIPSDPLAFLVAGGLATTCYVVMLTLLLWFTGRGRVPDGRVGESRAPEE